MNINSLVFIPYQFIFCIEIIKNIEQSDFSHKSKSFMYPLKLSDHTVFIIIFLFFLTGFAKRKLFILSFSFNVVLIFIVFVNFINCILHRLKNNFE